MIKVGILQQQCGPEPEKNIQATEKAISQAAEKGGQILCLQELFNIEYPCAKEDPTQFNHAEPVPGPATEKMQSLAKELQVVIIVPVFEKRAPGIYHNTTAVIDADGTYLGKYRKMHIPDDPGFYEKYYFTPGDLGFKVFNTRYGNLGILICWDQWFPEAARITALMGADVLFYPSAIGYSVDEPRHYYPEQLNAWQAMHQSHAIANGVPVVAVNRTGQEDKTVFWGQSFVCNPFGKMLYQAPEKESVADVIDIDTSETEFYRQQWPFLRDRRTDVYRSLQYKFIDSSDKL